jgi:hypothetical protein
LDKKYLKEIEKTARRANARRITATSGINQPIANLSGWIDRADSQLLSLLLFRRDPRSVLAAGNIWKIERRGDERVRFSRRRFQSNLEIFPTKSLNQPQL